MCCRSPSISTRRYGNYLLIDIILHDLKEIVKLNRTLDHGFDVKVQHVEYIQAHSPNL